MKVLVAIKRVIDYKAVVRVKADGSWVETNNVKMSINPFDEIAIEEALRLKEKKVVTETIVVTIGPEACQETLRTALAMGVDKAIHILSNENVEPLVVAKLLKALAMQEEVKLILLGKQAIDSDDNQVGQMLAGLLNWAQGTFASKLEFHDASVDVTREIDGGLETLILQLPAVITTDLRLNEPRYISLPNIVQAKRKPLTTISMENLGIENKPSITVLQVAMPQKRSGGVKVDTVAELMDKLKNEAQVL